MSSAKSKKPQLDERMIEAKHDIELPAETSSSQDGEGDVQAVVKKATKKQTKTAAAAEAPNAEDPVKKPKQAKHKAKKQNTDDAEDGQTKSAERERERNTSGSVPLTGSSRQAEFGYRPNVPPPRSTASQRRNADHETKPRDSLWHGLFHSPFATTRELEARKGQLTDSEFRSLWREKCVGESQWIFTGSLLAGPPVFGAVHYGLNRFSWYRPLNFRIKIIGYTLATTLVAALWSELHLDSCRRRPWKGDEDDD